MTSQIEPVKNAPDSDPSETATAPEAPSGDQNGYGGVRQVLTGKVFESSLTVLGFIALFIGYTFWLGDRFTVADSRLLDVHQNVPILILALAAVVTLVAGVFDLSIAAMTTLVTFLAVGLTFQYEWPLWLVLITCVAAGAVGGLVNGLIVEVLQVNTFIATLGTGSVMLGLSAVFSGGTLISDDGRGGEFPKWFTALGSYSVSAPAWLIGLFLVLAALGIYASLNRIRPTTLPETTWKIIRAVIVVIAALVLIFVLNLPGWVGHVSWSTATLLMVAVVLWTLLEFTTYGRSLQAAGANPAAARLAGVRVEREVIKAFMLGGVLAALAGILLAANQASATPNMAGGFLLPAFAAAFLSTVVLSSGRFTVWGTILGGTFVLWVSQGLIIGGLDQTWTDVVNGSVLVLAVSLSTIRRRTTR